MLQRCLTSLRFCCGANVVTPGEARDPHVTRDSSNRLLGDLDSYSKCDAPPDPNSTKKLRRAWTPLDLPARRKGCPSSTGMDSSPLQRYAFSAQKTRMQPSSSLEQLTDIEVRSAVKCAFNSKGRPRLAYRLAPLADDYARRRQRQIALAMSAAVHRTWRMLEACHQATVEP